MNRSKPGRKRDGRSRNYRAHRQNISILNVRLRSNVRNRIALRKLVVYGLPLVLVALAVWAGNLLWPKLATPAALEDPAYTVRTISVETDGTVPRERILEIAGVEEGNNIFEADLKAIHDRLINHAQFQQAEVRRELPDKLSIAVSERRPVALVAQSQEEMQADADVVPPAEWMIDPSGMLLELDDSVAEFGALPVVLIRADPALRTGKTINREEVSQAIVLVEMINDRLEAGLFRLVLVDTFRGYALDTVGENGTRVTFGRSQLKDQVERLARLLEFCDDTGQKLASVNLMVERNIPANFGEPAEPPLRPIMRAGIALPAQDDVPQVRRALPVQEITSPFQQATSVAESITDGER